MTRPPTAATTPDITPIRRLIRKTLVLLRSSWVLTGLGLTVGCFLATLVAAALLDLAAPLWSAFRLAALVMIVAPTAWAFLFRVVGPLFRRMGPRKIAHRIESHIPGIHNRLVTCLDLEKTERRSAAFYHRLVQEAIRRIEGFRASQVVDFRSLRRASLLAAAGALAFAITFGLFADALPTAMARIFSPFADIPPASGVLYTVEPGDAKVLRGEDLTILAHVEKGEPDGLRLELRGDRADGPLWYDLRRVDDTRWKVTLRGIGMDDRKTKIDRSFDFRVHGGGTWTRLKTITIVDRPRIIGLHTVTRYPEYMGIPEPRVGSPQIADVTGPEGSVVEVVTRADGDVARGEIQRLVSTSRRIAIPERERVERVWFQERLPDGANAEGNWQWDMRLLARPVHTEPPANGSHGHLFQNAAVPFRIDPGENLFAYVYVQPDQKPETIMIQWHDGSGWEHRAFWGEDKIGAGQPGTPSRRSMGPIPPSGDWVRLEVPAEAVGLEGKLIRGMSFNLSGGQCYWHKAGAMPAGHKDSRELEVVARFPVRASGHGVWAGTFPLDRDGLYRVELRDELGNANKAMKPAKIVAVPDNPPQVALERPGIDLVLSEPSKVPLVIVAHDDFGLASIVLSVQKGDAGGFVGRPVQRFDKPVRDASLVATLDLPAMDLKVGEHVRYRVEVRDRKDQTAQTQDYVVRIANDPTAADKQLANFEHGQDAAREGLDKLIAEQAKVGEAIAGAVAKEPAKLREELGQVAGKEERNVRAAEQIAQEMAKAADQAANLQNVPTPIVDEMRTARQAFQDMAVRPMKGLADDLKQGAGSDDKGVPDLEAMKNASDRLQKELQAAKARLEALAKARGDLRKDPAEALAQLKRDMLKQQAGATARDMEGLRDVLKGMNESLKDLEEHQAQLADAAGKVPDLMLPDLEKRQETLDEKAERELDEARALLKARKAKARKQAARDPDFPERAEDQQDGDGSAPSHQGEDDEAAAPFEPALGGPKPKAEPRAAGEKARPAAKKAEGDASQHDGNRRDELNARQRDQLGDLESARRSIESDRNTLGALSKELNDALGKGDEGAADQVMRSPTMQQAREMAARARQLRPDSARPRPAAPGQPPMGQPGSDDPEQARRGAGVAPAEDVLKELDINTRSIILKMQPKLREELLQGLREEGPEGYRKHIRDYFGRLTRVKGTQP